MKCYIWSIALHGAETWTLRKVDQKYLERFEIRCWRKMEKIGRTERVRSEVVHRVNWGNQYSTYNKKTTSEANWIGHVVGRNCLLKHIIEGKIEVGIEVTGRRGRIRKQLLDDREETRGYWKLKGNTLERTQWRTRFGRNYGPKGRQTTEWIN